MWDNINENMLVNNEVDIVSFLMDKDDIYKDRFVYFVGGNDMKIIVLMSDIEVDGEGILIF